MSKLPAFQFYPGDWRKDPGVQSLTFEERGIWIEILCIMHQSESPGKLLLGGEPISNDRLANILCLDSEKISKTISTFLKLGVAGLCPTTGAVISRRMVSDAELIEKRRQAGRAGGNPAFKKGNSNPYYEKDKQGDKQGDKQKITPSSSSSTSTSIDNTPSHRARLGAAPGWMNKELSDAWTEWGEHLFAKDIIPTPPTLRAWVTQLQRECPSPQNQQPAIAVIQLSIQKQAKSLCFGGDFANQRSAGRSSAPQTEAARDEAKTGIPKQKFNVRDL